MKYNIEGCRQFALQGHLFERNTCFEDINSSSVHEHISANNRGLKFFDWLKIGSNELSINSYAYKKTLVNSSEAFLNAFKFVTESDLHLSITGGRDSRLLASALSNLSCNHPLN